jgi:hypothetical protein
MKPKSNDTEMQTRMLGQIRVDSLARRQCSIVDWLTRQ